MTGLHRLPRRDLEKLSAYLDGELTPAEAARLDARLREEAPLAEALAEMRATKRALGLLPMLRPPRNFTLTPEMAGIREPRRYPVLRWASALATLAFMAACGLDAFGVLSRGVSFGASAPAPMAAEMQSAVLEATATEPANVPPTAAAEESAPILAEAPPAADAIAPPMASPEIRSLGVAVTPLGLGGGPPATEGDLEAQAAVPTKTPPSEAEILGSAAATPAPTVGPTPLPAEDYARAAATEAPPSRLPSATPRVPTIRWAEIGFAGAAIVLAMLSLRGRRKR
ncbi:MAG: zf-HC2 domain-containing protein [Anaerolineales bacterium]|nr:zf-HC2 domain-containing protein [Anaerolineales bacterium]